VLRDVSSTFILVYTRINPGRSKILGDIFAEYPGGSFTIFRYVRCSSPGSSFPYQVPCIVTRGGCGSAGVRCTPMVERHDDWVMIEGRSPELGRRRVYHRGGCSNIGPRHRRCPRFCAAPISARQHLIHIAATLSYPLCASTHRLFA
jgi:hypothetical protein